MIIIPFCSIHNVRHVHVHVRIHAHVLPSIPFPYLSLMPCCVCACSQLHMFLQLMEQAPEVLQALGMSPDTLKQEIVKMEQVDKLKVK